MPLINLLIEVGNGESEVIGMRIVSNEQRRTIQKIKSFFKHHSEKWNKVCGVVMEPIKNCDAHAHIIF